MVYFGKIIRSTRTVKAKTNQNEVMIGCPLCGIEIAKEKLKQHQISTHAKSSMKDLTGKSIGTGNKKPTAAAIKKANRRDAQDLARDLVRLEALPLEYQATAYSKLQKEKRMQQDAQKRDHLKVLRSKLKELKEKLTSAQMPTVRADLQQKIVACQKAIKTAPKPKSNWSPILPGSFESGS